MYVLECMCRLLIGNGHSSTRFLCNLSTSGLVGVPTNHTHDEGQMTMHADICNPIKKGPGGPEARIIKFGTYSQIPPSMSSISSSSSEVRKKMGEIYHGFNDRSKEATAARATYLKIFIGGSFMTILLIFSIFSIFWGALWKIPAHNLPGWVVVSVFGLSFARLRLMLTYH